VAAAQPVPDGRRQLRIPLDTSAFSGGAPDGNYELSYRQDNRVSGIVNLANSSSG
jgi:hypothetical protein